MSLPFLFEIDFLLGFVTCLNLVPLDPVQLILTRGHGFILNRWARIFNAMCSSRVRCARARPLPGYKLH